MAEGAFRDKVSLTAVAAMADCLTRQGGHYFRHQDFHEALGSDYENLPLKGRISAITQALTIALPDDFVEASDLMLEALEQPSGGRVPSWCIWAMTEYVGRHGLDNPRHGLSTLRRMTRFFTAEFGVRPFLARFPDLTLQEMRAWTCDPSPSVRRLASEGSRPLLPWAQRVPWLVETPAATRPILDALAEDASAMVRRSVTNHLNDVGRLDAPAALETAAQWRDRDMRRSDLRHALRGLLKRCDAGAIALMGCRQGILEVTGAGLAADTIPVGGTAKVSLLLHNPTDRPEVALVDFAIVSPGQRQARRRVIKGSERTIAPHQTLTFSRRVSLAPTSGRDCLPGCHNFCALINGEEIVGFRIDVLPAGASPQTP